MFSADAELWAYPLDGSPAYPFLPASPTHLYFGREYVTGVGFYPEDSERLWLYRRRVGGEFEVIADRLRSGVSYGQYLEHPWTPELGRILYAVEDGDAVSIRQHRLED